MKAIVLHGAGGDYRYEPDWVRPEVPDGWALVKVAYCGVCGSDIPRFRSEGSYHHPVILGHEFSGVVEEPAGPDSLFRKGDPVAVAPIIPCGSCEGCRKHGPFHCAHYQFLGSRNDGGFAEYCAVPESNLIRLMSVDLIKAGCLVEPAAVGLHAVRRSGFAPGKHAIVFGAGPIGLIIGIWLRAFGAGRVVMADLRRGSIEMAANIGFETIDLSRADLSSIGQADFAFEAAGSAKVIRDAVSILKARGTLTVVGRDIADTVIAHGSFEALMRKEIALIGCWGYDLDGEGAFVARTLAEYRRELESLITHVVPIEDAAGAIGELCAGKIECCKLVVSF